jgi:hypothetical protein
MEFFIKLWKKYMAFMRVHLMALDNFGTVSLETAASTAGTIFLWALIIQLVGNLFKYILYGIKGTASSIWNSIVKSFSNVLQWGSAT